jgi:ABC-type branched-subunit amino acid transport system ATPase component
MSQRAYVLREGRIVLSGASAELRSGDALQRAFLGGRSAVAGPAPQSMAE